MAGSGSERKRKRKKVHHESSESEGGSDKEWNDHDNNDYIDFLKEFLFPGQSMEVNDDDDADPEYNIMEDEEEHDSEEFRRDPAVKISKKEFNELISELYDESFARSKVDSQCQTADNESQTCAGVSVVESDSKPPPPPPPQPVVEEEKVEPLITEHVQGIIKYQLQQHIQLLAQTYVLTAACNEEQVKPLARESKKMIIELHSFALNYGPDSAFKVKNISYAATLVNSWPHSFISKSPIKKKILEEQYRNEIIKIPGGIGTFTREVVKVISESKAFMYPQLLPVFPHLHSPLKINFTKNEDALIAIGFREMRNKIYEPLQLKKKAKLISDLLLPGRPRLQVYNRIKNARKRDKDEKIPNCGLLTLRKYLKDGDPPPSPLESWTTDMLQIEPIEPVNQEKLPSQWVSVLKQLKIDALFKDDSVDLELKKPRVRKSRIVKSPQCDQEKPSTVKKSKTKKSETKSKMVNNLSYPVLPPDNSPEFFSSSAFSEELERFPVLDKNGKPAAYISIPKKFCNTSQPMGTASQEKGDVSSSNEDCIDVTPEQLNSPSPLKTSSKVLDVTPVGVPFSLPCLSENFPGALVDFHTLESPLKREIFEKASEGDKLGERPSKKLTNANSCTSVVSIKNTQTKTSSKASAELPKSVLTVYETCEESNNKIKYREDHSARTWIYNRKSPEQLVLAREKKLKDVKKPKLKKDTHPCRVPSSRRKTTEKCKRRDTKTPPKDSRTNSDFTNESDSDSSIPSLFEEKICPPVSNVKASMKHPISSRVLAPMDGGDQKESDAMSSSPNSDTKNKAASSGSRNRSTKRDSSKQAAGDGDDEDDQNPDRNKRQPSSKLDSSDHHEEDTEDDNEERLEKEAPGNATTKPSTSKSLGTSTKVKSEVLHGAAPPKAPRRMKRSPGSQTKRRAPKFKTTEIQKLLDEAESEVDIEAIETAFAEEFWAKCQHTLDPVLYNNLIQVFCDFGEKYANEEEVFGKAEELLKDHPELLIDLASMTEPQLLQKNNLLKDNYVVQAYVRFMHLLECPQLRARALQKIRGLRDLEKVTEKDVQELVDLFFQANPIMTDAVKAMFPNIFPPQSTVRPQDFEEINFDGNLPYSEEGMGMEFVNFPEEASVPATASCPCDCHTDSKNINLHTKARHCRKCCIKFQDGKVFMHSGRVMKQVNIEFTTKEKAEEILARRACGHCFEPIKGTASPKRKSNERSNKKRTSKPTKVAISDYDSETELKKPPTSAVPSTSKSIPVEILEDEVHISADTIPKTKTIKEPEDDLEDGEIVDDEEQANDRIPTLSNMNCQMSTKPETENYKSSKKSAAVLEKKSKIESQKSLKPWTYDEDKILLVTCQQETSTTVAFTKIIQRKLLPNRTLDDLKDRFSCLVNMIMKSSSATSSVPK